MIKLYFVLFITSLLLQLSVAERISTKKCREYSDIKSTKSYPHMVWLRIATEKIIVVNVIGVLISDQYVLTSAVRDLITYRSQVYFTPDESNNIVEIHEHPLFNISPKHHDIALLKLENKVVLDGNHRPACLWTEKKFNDTDAVLFKWGGDWKDEFVPSNQRFISDADCSASHNQHNVPIICLRPVNKEDNKFVPTVGSPVQVKKSGTDIPDNYYILGIFSFYFNDGDPYTMSATKLNDELDWIENIVWPKPKLTKRISEKKCMEYSVIPTTKPNPHMVWLRVQNKNFVLINVLGVLISEEYVLTSWIEDLVPYKSQVYFTTDEAINIVEIQNHPLFQKDPKHHDLALLKLETKVKLDGNHRPACLWTHNEFESDAVLFKWGGDWKDEYIPAKHRFISDAECTASHSQHNVPIFCLRPVNKEDNKFVPTPGSPVQIKKSGNLIQENFYVLGIFSFYFSDGDPHTMAATKLTDELDWIESIVWPSRNNHCGNVKVQHQDLISLTSTTSYGEFPWHVAIQKREGRCLRKYICGGTILNKNTILTAAHCILDKNGVTSPNLLTVSLGQYDLDNTNKESREIKVSEVIPHENFILNYLENDIAVLKLTDAISFSNYIEPICITNDSSIFSTNIEVVAGWGSDEENNLQLLLSKASLPIVSNIDCRNSNRDLFTTYLNDGNFCARYGNGTSICSGDSGSGLVFESDGHWYIHGIVSLGSGFLNEERCNVTQLVLFTDVVKFYDWIVDKF